MFKFELPFPPSVNHYWRHVGSRVLVSSRGRKYRSEVNSLLRRKKIKPLEGDLIVDITLRPPDRRRRDVDNYMKALLDAMQSGGVYLDDSQIVRLTIEKRDPMPKAGAVDVIVQGVPHETSEFGYRTCLRCDVAFASSGPGNRICRRCTRVNDRLPANYPIVRGRKLHNGKPMQ